MGQREREREKERSNDLPKVTWVICGMTLNRIEDPDLLSSGPLF